VGESLDTSSHTTWAYQAPEIQSVTARAVYVEGRTSRDTGVVEVTVESSGDTRAFRLESQEQEVSRQSRFTTFQIDLPTGSQTVRVMPLSQYAPPTEGMSSGATAQTQVTVVGT